MIALESQKEVAGYLLLNPSNIPDAGLILDLARVGRFVPVDGLARHVYEAACEGLLGYTAIADRLNAHGVDTNGLLEMLGAAPINLPTDAIARIDEAYERRCIQTAGKHLVSLAEDTSLTVDEVIGKGQHYLSSVPVVARNEGISGLDVLDGLDQQNAIYPPCKYVDASAALDYCRFVPLVEGSNNIVAAGPGEGKSVLAWAVAREWAMQGAQVAILAYEMGRHDYIDWELARLTSMPVDRLLMGRLPRNNPIDPFTSAEQKLVDQAKDQIRCWIGNVRFYDGDDVPALEDAFVMLRRLRQQGMVDLVMIDHLHIAKVAGRDEKEQAAIASRWSQRIAARLSVPVLALAQMNREGRKSGGRGDDAEIAQFQLSDLLGSGRLEADAHSVTFLQQAIKTQGNQFLPNANKNSKTTMPLWMIGQVRKNRVAGGRCGDWGQELIRGRFAYVPVSSTT